MPPLFGFGISQEDYLTEQSVLAVQPGDRILSIASGGEVPLSLMAVNENIRVCAVDISTEQIRICRLKQLAAVHIDFPENGAFIGYAGMKPETRKELFNKKILPELTKAEREFWKEHADVISKGVVNAGKFEIYARKLRMFVFALMGKKNIFKLINCTGTEAQQQVFDEKIEKRKLLQLLFRIAFRPSVYKNRGLQEQALMYADNSTGNRFYSKFRNFCTGSPAVQNYFLQYYLTGCVNNNALPVYLHPENKARLLQNLKNFELIETSVSEVLKNKPHACFNKIHLSNIGDWISEEDFLKLMELIKARCEPGTVICSRHLHNNQMLHLSHRYPDIVVENCPEAEIKDRFPFYGITGGKC